METISLGLNVLNLFIETDWLADRLVYGSVEWNISIQGLRIYVDKLTRMQDFGMPVYPKMQ